MWKMESGTTDCLISPLCRLITSLYVEIFAGHPYHSLKIEFNQSLIVDITKKIARNLAIFLSSSKVLSVVLFLTFCEKV